MLRPATLEVPMFRTSVALAALLSILTACGQEMPDPPPAGAGGTDGAIEDDCDRDGDGALSLACGGDDCDDDDPERHPGAVDRCGNAIDENCSGEADEGCECLPGEWRGCWPDDADPHARNVGTCVDGVQRCNEEGRWSACEEAVLPTEEGATCDGLDQDCDGTPDGAQLDACGGCGWARREICGNGLDDDCNGVVDDPGICRFTCGGVASTNPSPDWLACCVTDPDDGNPAPLPVTRSYRCVEAPSLPGCDDAGRACLSFEEGTNCVKRCDESGSCVCGVDGAGGVVRDDRCGFETPCAFLGCEEKLEQPCYSGPPQTLGVGICRAGRTDCTDGAWGTCLGEVTPVPEICGNGFDDDCDGLIDEADGVSGARCVTGAICAAGAEEICGNGLDDDCDGAVDEGCEAALGATQACYRGPAFTRGIGACVDGVQQEEAGMWGPCRGDVLPAGERCGDGIDSNCDGYGGPGQPDDRGCGSAEEICNNLDDDGDGRIDEGLLNDCGTCAGSCESHLFTELGDCSAPSRDCVMIESTSAPRDTGITVAQDKRNVGDAAAYVYFIVNPCFTWLDLDCDDQRLGQFDPTTGAFNWLVPIPDGGATHVRQLAVAADNSVWVGLTTAAIRDPDEPGRDWADETRANLYHFDRRGNLLCRTNVPGGIFALALDTQGSVWVANGVPPLWQATWPPDVAPRRHLLRFHRSRIEPTRPDGTPWPGGLARCSPIDLAPNDADESGMELPEAAEFLAVDSRNILWASGPAHPYPGIVPGTSLLRVDTRTLTLDVVPSSTGNSMRDEFGNKYAVLAPWGAIYHGFLNSSGQPVLVELDADGPWGPFVYGQLLDHERVVSSAPAGFNPAVVAADGTIWGRAARQSPPSDVLAHLSPATGSWELFAPFEPFDQLGWMEMDHLGRIWTLGGAPGGSTGNAMLFAYDPASSRWLQFQPDPGVHMRSSLSTGADHRRVLAASGRWTETLRASYPGTRWLELDWHEQIPAGSSIEAWVRFGNSEEELDAAVACPFAGPPADLSQCEGNDKPLIAIEFVLRPAADGSRPQLFSPSLRSWRP